MWLPPISCYPYTFELVKLIHLERSHIWTPHFRIETVGQINSFVDPENGRRIKLSYSYNRCKHTQSWFLALCIVWLHSVHIYSNSHWMWWSMHDSMLCVPSKQCNWFFESLMCVDTNPKINRAFHHNESNLDSNTANKRIRAQAALMYKY